MLIALAGLFVVAGVGATAIALLPTSDHDPINSIRVEAPQGVRAIPPAPQSLPEPQAPRPSAPAAPPPPPPTLTPPVSPPADVRGVPEPPPAIWNDDDGHDDDGDWDDDDDDDGWDDDGDDD